MWGHGKSVQTAVGLPIWLLGKDPTLRILVVCNTDSNAMKRVGAARRYMAEDSDYASIFPLIRQMASQGGWTQHSIYLAGRVGTGIDPSLESAGIDSSGTGGRKDIIIFDDIEDENDADSETVREHRIEQVERVWLPRLEPDGRVFLIGTTWATNGNHAKLKANPRWLFLTQGVSEDFSYIEQEVEGERKNLPLWEERWGREALIARCTDIGIRSFGRGFRQRAFSPSDRVFPSFEKCVLRGCNPWGIATPQWKFVSGVDLSTNAREGNVIATTAVDPVSGLRVPVDLRIGDWSSPQTAQEILSVWKTFQPEVILVENNAYQQSLVDWIKHTCGRTDVPIKPFTTTRNKVDPDMGLPALEVEFFNEAWRFCLPNHLYPCRENAGQKCNWCRLYDEFSSYPASATSDVVMACWFCRQAALMIGYAAKVHSYRSISPAEQERWKNKLGYIEKPIEEVKKELEELLRKRKAFAGEQDRRDYWGRRTL